MAHKLDIGLMGSVLIGALVLAAPAVSWSAEGATANNSAQMVQRMESHWQTLIRERDPIKRKALVAEHRKMMAESMTTQGMSQTRPMGDQRGQGGMMGPHHQHDLQNTAEMHTMMLDMMK